MRTTLLLLIVGCLAGCGGFGGHKDLLVVDSEATRPVGPGSLRVTYLGCNGYLLESSDAAVLIDPYFSRVQMHRVGLGLEIEPNHDRIAAALDQLDDAELRRKLRAILVTHGHFDHLMDVPVLAKDFDVPVVGSPTTGFLAQAAGVASERIEPVEPGEARSWPGVSVRVLPATHDRLLFGDVPYEGQLSAVPEHPPQNAEDWLLGRPLAFLVEIQGLRVYVDSGGTDQLLPPDGIAPVDLAILGVATADSRERLPETLRRLRPRYLLPSHQDDFFKPLADGFHYGPLADMDAVRRAHQTMSSAGGKLILLDYFQPWTLSPAADTGTRADRGNGDA